MKFTEMIEIPGAGRQFPPAYLPQTASSLPLLVLIGLLSLGVGAILPFPPKRNA